jgi:uncharacterized damage-inducible protein DinB
MENHEFFVQRWESEQPAFGKVLRAMPGDQLAYRPHERSKSAGDLAWQLAEEQRGLCDLLESGEIKWEARPRPATAEEIVTAWETATGKLRGQLQRLDASTCARPAKMLMDGTPVWTDTIGNMLWGYLFDMVHHRGQLSTYLRPMGGKVPAIYGPSADDSGE